MLRAFDGDLIPPAVRARAPRARSRGEVVIHATRGLNPRATRTQRSARRLGVIDRQLAFQRRFVAPTGRRGADAASEAASWPHAAAMSRPRVRRTVAGTPRSMSVVRKSLDRLAARAAEGPAGRVVRDQVHLERLARREQRGQGDRLLAAIVDAAEHQVLDVDAPASRGAPPPAGFEHVGERIAVVDRHQLRAQRVVGGMQRERQPSPRSLARSGARFRGASRRSRSSCGRSRSRGRAAARRRLRRRRSSSAARPCP